MAQGVTTANATTVDWRAFSTRWLGDDVTYIERTGATSLPLDNLDVTTGERMPEDSFPVLWPN